MTIKIQFKQTLGETNFDIDLSLPRNEISALFGRSGAGKTTLINVISGLVTPQQAELQLVITSCLTVNRGSICQRINVKSGMYFRTRVYFLITLYRAIFCMG